MRKLMPTLDHGLTPSEWQLVEKVEEKRKAFFLGVFPVGGMNCKCFVFWNEEKHPRGSNYFGLYWNGAQDSWMVINAGSVHNKLFQGILKRGKVIYSRYRHDCRYSGKDMIDGGWDYQRYSLNTKRAKIVHCMISDGKVIIQTNEAEDGKKGKKTKAKRRIRI